MARLLVIDDERPVLEMLKISLSAEGYEVMTAENGNEGIKIFKDEGPKLVLTDRSQRCLAYLIRKVIALADGAYEKGQRFGAWVLRELRGLIKTMSEGGEDARLDCNSILARLKRGCLLGKDGPIKKMQALAREILNDWDAVVAFVKNPELPPTNNEAERALRHAE